MLLITLTILGMAPVARLFAADRTIALPAGKTLLPPGKTRVIDFHSTKSLGLLRLVPACKTGEYFMADEEKASGKDLAPAVDKMSINVPAGWRLGIEFNKRLFDDPKLMEGITPDGIDIIYITSKSMDDSEDERLTGVLPYLPHFRTLKELFLDKSDLGDAQLMKLPELKTLESFSCFLCDGINGSCLERLSRFPKLRYVSFWDTVFESKNIKYLKNMPQLETVNLSDCRMDTAGMKLLGTCTQLKRVYLAWNHKLKDGDLDYLLPLKNLEDLDLRSVPISDKGVAVLAKFKHLKRLKLLETKVTPEGLAFLKNMHLQTLAITDHHYTDAQIKTLETYCPQVSINRPPRIVPVDKETARVFAPISRHRILKN